MRTSRIWQTVAVVAAALTMLILATGSSAMATATYTVSTASQLNGALLLVNPGDTIVLNPKTYYTADATTPANGFEIATPNVTIRGKTNSSGNCTNLTTTIIDGDNKPTTSPGHVGPAFMVEAANIQFKCFTMRYGTAGIVSDGFNGLNVTTMNFVGNGRDLNPNTVTNAWYRCFYVNGDFAKFLSNTCITSHDYEGVSLNGDNITADNFSTSISSGGTYESCVNATGDFLKLTNTKCGATRDFGIQVHGDDATVTNAQVRQSNNTCFNADGDRQTWMNATCGPVTGTDSDDYGLYAGGVDSTFTNIS